MWKVILGVLIAMVVLAVAPIPTQVFTVTKSIDEEQKQKGTIVGSASVPSGSQLFEDVKEVLASITSFYNETHLLSIEMSTVSSTNQIEKPYQMNELGF
jgi:hypothetical protein